jgi:3',5'-cyclic AMP phosphodiesterase CpdA
LTDIHINKVFNVEAENRLRKLVNEINGMNPKPAFVLITGDLVDWGSDWGVFHSGTANFKKFNEIMTDLTVPYHTTPGNHDYRRVHQISPPYDISNYKTYIKSDLDYKFTEDDYYFAGMDSGSDVWELSELSGGLTPEGTGLESDQVTWLEDRLVESGSKKKFIFMHHPAVSTENDYYWKPSKWTYVWDEGAPVRVAIVWTRVESPDGAPGGNNGAISKNRADLMSLAESSSVSMVLTGHTHVDEVLKRDGTDYPSNTWDIDEGPMFVQTAAALDLNYTDWCGLLQCQ